MRLIITYSAHLGSTDWDCGIIRVLIIVVAINLQEAFGQINSHELKEGGIGLPVTEDNKHEYIDLMLRWRLDRGVAKQMESFKKGFSEVMPVNLLYNFDAQELEFLTAGTLEIDVDDWRAHTEYRNGNNIIITVLYVRTVELNLELSSSLVYTTGRVYQRIVKTWEFIKGGLTLNTGMVMCLYYIKLFYKAQSRAFPLCLYYTAGRVCQWIYNFS